MEVKSVSDLRWINPEHTAFDCVLMFEGSDMPHPFACNQIEVGVLPYVTQLWEAVLAGEYGSIAEYVLPSEYSTKPQPDQPVVDGAVTL